MKRSASDTLACFTTKKVHASPLEQDEQDTHQSSANAKSAVAKVWNTTELVELTLLNLDLLDLATAVRTNRFFRNVEFGSTKIKQALFLLTEPEQPLQYLIDSLEGEITPINPKSTPAARNVHQTLLTTHLLNPALKIDDSKLTDTPHPCSYLELEDKITCGRHVVLPYHAYVDSTLRDMLVLQPPVSKVSFTAKPDLDGTAIYVDVTNYDGVRIGDLVQAVMLTGMVGNVQYLAGHLRADYTYIATAQELSELESVEGKWCPMGKKFMREAFAHSDGKLRCIIGT
ncbi:hypothetical protein AC579_9140 [Pseudocercospora musae]|uniref:Uncharacterized protein n=1 Tax=Pseudocercospora musae TaxID=113226 RepID=A0A139III2_9PEZI|nr:hypothetical protein AC579_9140 [Pseudocercospora musae]